MRNSTHKWFLLSFGLCAVLSVPACRQQMASQPSFRPFNKSEFFPNQNSSRPIVEGTVARSHLKLDRQFYLGEKANTNPQAFGAGVIGGGAVNPLAAAMLAKTSDPNEDRFPLKQVAAKLHIRSKSDTETWQAVLKRGQVRYNIYCSMCHDKVGDGKGMIVQRGYAPPPSLHLPRLSDASDGYIFRVISHGYGAMPAYSSMIPTEDRWTIIAYVRALQLSQNADLKDVSAVLDMSTDRAAEEKEIPERLLNQLKEGK